MVQGQRNVEHRLRQLKVARFAGSKLIIHSLKVSHTSVGLEVGGIHVDCIKPFVTTEEPTLEIKRSVNVL
jgi:hypothetical protein